MKCPHCGGTLGSPYGASHTVSGTKIILLGCPHCKTYLGAVKA